MGKKNSCIWSLGWLLAVVATTAALAQPRLSRLRAESNASHLYAVIDALDLFSDEMVGTIQSGLPAAVEIHFRLIEAKGDPVLEGIDGFELLYDVWEDHYVVTGNDTAIVYADFQGMQRSVERGARLRIAPLRMLEAGSLYRIQCRLTVQPLKRMDRDRIETWVSRNTEGSEPGQVKKQFLNLNDLIGHFFRRDREVENRSGWVTSDAFVADEARVSGQGEINVDP